MPPKSSKTSSIAKKKKKTVVVDLSDSEDDNDMNSINSGDESEVLVVEPPKKSAASTKQKSPSKTKSPSSSKAPSSPKKLPKSPEAAEPVNDSFDVILPPLLGTNSNGECTILVQLDPHDAATLDYEGVSGAIGRFEADDRGVTLDLKGCQYQGSILPGPTAIVVGFSRGQLKAEAITDEFSRLVKTQDIMAKLDAVVKGEMDDGFRVREDNVNYLGRNSTKEKQASAQETKASSTTGSSKKKRASSSTPGGTASAKKRKTNPKTLKIKTPKVKP